MTRTSVRNGTFLVAAMLFGMTGTEAGQTCAQAGFEGIGPNCAENTYPFSTCADCIQGYCMMYAGGENDCAVDCVLGAAHWCS